MSKTEKIKLLAFVAIAIVAITYATFKVNTDASVHAGKDHGWGYRLEYHVYLSIFFFVLMCRKPTWMPVFALAGFITAIVTVVLYFLGIGYISNFFSDILNVDSGLCVQVLCIGMTIAIFYLFERVLIKTKYNS